VNAAVTEVRAKFGRIDILVNNEDGVAGMRTLEYLTDADWLATIELDLFSAVRTTRAVMPGMLEAGWRRVINDSSELAVQPDAVMAGYNSAKGALNVFTKTLSEAYAGRGILVNVVSPAFTVTPTLAGFIDRLATSKGNGRRM
jgi:3-oxoacyl-[acyl-carrier protein] reductase